MISEGGPPRNFTLAVRARPVLPPLLARGVAFAALCGFGLLHWMLMLDPSQPARALAGLLVALGTALAVQRAPGRWAWLAGAAGVVAALLVGGVAVRELWHLNELGTSVSDGVGGVGGARIPYPGVDPDLRLVIPAGGTLLATVAALLAFAPPRGHRLAALFALVTLYAVPAVALELRAEFLRGAILSMLVLLFLRLERVAQRELAAAAGLAAAAAVAALAAAPALDTKRPWFNYEAFAQDTVNARSTTFDWDHDYAALPWVRDGREMLRVSSPRRAYWKADTLETFDGFRWLQNPTPGAPPDVIAEDAGISKANLERWTFPIQVEIRNLRSPTLALAGVPQTVDEPGRTPGLVAPAIWSAGRVVHRGDAYRAQVYVPEPTRAQLSEPAQDYPQVVADDTAFDAIGPVGGEAGEFIVPRFKARPQAVSVTDTISLRRSNLLRIYALARRLERGAATPYDYLRAIARHLGSGYTYDETPPRAARTLDGFLFDAKAGFCQQFSGAMALLLRMGGVPARVATGFAPGSYDAGSKRYVVRDIDAHSWVEAYFPTIGWVVFDPTPAAAPPRSQALGTDVSAGNGDLRDRGELVGARVRTPRHKPPWGAFALIAAALAAVGAFARTLWRGRPERVEMSELERALLGAGERCAPSTTLKGLEARLPAAAAYLRALRDERYAAGAGPTSAERRDLRRALTRGRGPRARLRTWLALRPGLRARLKS